MPMKFGLDVPTTGDFADPRTLAALAVDAEQAGWDGFFIWDIVFDDNRMDAPVADPWIALAAIAAQTHRIRIGAMVTPLPRRRPWEVARQAVALDQLSNGRLIFGAGLGYQALDFTPFGEAFDPRSGAEKLDEGLAIVDGLWTGQPFGFHGKWHHLEEVVFLPKPLQTPRIPVWVAGGWPNRRPLRRAARWDGIYLLPTNRVTNERLRPEEIQEIASYIYSHRERRHIHRDAAPLNAAATFDLVVTGETPPDPQQGAEFVQPYFDAGATWWVEVPLTDVPISAASYRQRIRGGPPRT